MDRNTRRWYSMLDDEVKAKSSQYQYKRMKESDREREREFNDFNIDFMV